MFGTFRPRHVALLSAYAVRFALRGGGLVVFFLLTLVFALVVGEMTILPVEKTRAYAARQGVPVTREVLIAQFGDAVREMIELVLVPADGGDSAGRPARSPGRRARPDDPPPDPELRRQLDFLIKERPAIFSAIFLVLAYGLPLLVASGAFNQFAGDIGDRGLRYLLLRTERTNLLLGRFLGTYAYTAAVFVPVVLALTTYVVLKIDVYGWRESLMFAGRAVLVCAILSAPWVALCTWLSSSFSSAFVAMTACTVTIIAVPAVAAWGRMLIAPEAGWLMYALPWWFHHWFFHPDLSRFAAATSLAFLYAGGYLAIGVFFFNRRDL